MLKKLCVLATATIVLNACSAIGSGTDSAANINNMRSKNAMVISEAQAKQQSRQRQAELEESATRNTKAQMGMGTAREGISTIRDGINLIQQIRNVF